MLARVDGAGIVRTGDYALTTLAAAVVQYFLTDEALTRESLTLLTATLSAQLAEVLAASKKAKDAESWRSKVSGPLRVTVSELDRGRGLDGRGKGYAVSATTFHTLEEALDDEHYPEVDLALRRGQHIGRDDGAR